MAELKNITVPEVGGPADVIEIAVKPGDLVTAETVIVILESDKTTLEIPATVAGTVHEVKTKLGDRVAVGTILLSVMLDAPDQNKASLLPEQQHTENQADENIKQESHAALIDTQPPLHTKDPSDAHSYEVKHSGLYSVERPPETLLNDDRIQTKEEPMIHAGPLVRRIARELGVNLALVQGRGPKQRILREDVHAFVKQQLTQSPLSTQPTTSNMPPLPDFTRFGPTVFQPLSRIKQISGKKLQQNWSIIPHVTQFGLADITVLEQFRQTHKSAISPKKLTLLAFIMQAVSATLKVFPCFNASFDAQTHTLILKQYFHIGVAVDTPQGLVVPVIHDVDKKNALTLAEELDLMGHKARQGKLTPLEMQGGCFSISNLGGVGGQAFTPIINFPEVAILGLSKAYHGPVYQEGVFVPRLLLPLSLSYDHRVIDGAEGARFMVHLENILSDIRCLLL